MNQQIPTSLIQVERPLPKVLLLTLNRPEKLNALSKELLTELAALLEYASADTNVSCVVLTGKGKAFSAGADITDMIERGVASYADPTRLQSWDSIQNFRKPLIAAVNGYALGGGLELALLCDILLASETAKFATPEIKIGSFPGDGGTQRLPRLVGQSFAMQMVLTGMMVDASLAERKGLVSEVLAANLLLGRALAVAAEIAEQSNAITPYAKAAVRLANETLLSEGLAQEQKLTIEAFATEDRMEGLRAFVDKRKPAFKGQ